LEAEKRSTATGHLNNESLDLLILDINYRFILLGHFGPMDDFPNIPIRSAVLIMTATPWTRTLYSNIIPGIVEILVKPLTRILMTSIQACLTKEAKKK